jgi:hypothetical protein
MITRNDEEQGGSGMLREINHGSINFNGNINSDALGELVAATFSTQKDHSAYFEVNAMKEEAKKPHLDIHTSNGRLDAYLFYYSSKL